MHILKSKQKIGKETQEQYFPPPNISETTSLSYLAAAHCYTIVLLPTNHAQKHNKERLKCSRMVWKVDIQSILLCTPCVAFGWGSLKIYNKSGGIQCTFLQLLVDRYISDFLCSVLWTILFPNSFMIINIRNCCRHMSVPAAGDWLDEVILCLRGDQETRRPPL